MAANERAKRRRKRRVAKAEVKAEVKAEGRANDPEAQPQPAPKPNKDDVARAQLEPLEEGERPLAVKIAAIVAAALVVAYLVAFLVGDANIGAGIPFVVALSVAAIGMWRGRYWAVLGFQVILALTLVNGMLFLIIRASSPVAIAGGLLITIAAGTLFWFLVKSLARLQMPERKPRTGAE